MSIDAGRLVMLEARGGVAWERYKCLRDGAAGSRHDSRQNTELAAYKHALMTSWDATIAAVEAEAAAAERGN